MGSYGNALRNWHPIDTGSSISSIGGDVLRYSAAVATTSAMPQRAVSILVKGGSTPKWFAAAQDALMAFLELPADWNSYAARQVDVGVIKETMDLLSEVMNDRLPTIVPVPSGGILLEWQTADKDVEVVVLPNGRVSLLYQGPGQPPIEHEYLTQEAYAPVREILRSL